jgi:hypothetical protein
MSHPLELAAIFVLTVFMLCIYAAPVRLTFTGAAPHALSSLPPPSR